MFVISAATGADYDNNDNNINNDDNGNDDDDNNKVNSNDDFYNFCLQTGNRRMCVHIANTDTFNDNLTVISLRGIHLSSSEVKHLVRFLTQSPHQERKEIDLCGCNIGDNGIAIFHQGLTEHNIPIIALSLSENDLTESSSCKVYEIAVCCKVKRLTIRRNPAIGKNSKLYLIISDPDSVVEELNISHTNSNQSSTATELFSALDCLKNPKRNLRILWINNNNLTDNDGNAIVKAIQNNTSLIEVVMHRNQFSVTTALRIIQALAYNNTLQYLTLPWYETNNHEKIIKAAKSVEEYRYCRTHIYCRKF